MKQCSWLCKPDENIHTYVDFVKEFADIKVDVEVGFWRAYDGSDTMCFTENSGTNLAVLITVKVYNA